MKFRGRRLTLRRGLATLEEALAFANEVRRVRFRDPESVFILREPDGLLVPEAGSPTSGPRPAATGGEHDGLVETLTDGGSPHPGPASIPPPPSHPGRVDGSAESYARAIAAALKVLGPTPRDHVLGMFRGLRLSDADAEAVLSFALAHALLFVDPRDPDRLDVALPGEPMRAPRERRAARARRAPGKKPSPGPAPANAAHLHATLAGTRQRAAGLLEAMETLQSTCRRLSLALERRS